VLLPLLGQLTIEPYMPKDRADALEFLAELVNRSVSRIQVLLATLQSRHGQMSSRPDDRHAFDYSHEGELLRRYEMACDRSFHRNLAQLRLLRKDANAPARGRGKRPTAAVAEESEAVADSIDRDDSDAQADLHGPPDPVQEPPPAVTGDDAEPPTANGPILPNEPVTASIDRDDSDAQADAHVRRDLRQEPPPGVTGDHAQPETENRPGLRNEPVAAPIDRDDSGGQADAHAPPAAALEPLALPHPQNTLPALLVPP
jgi:hypothetical protein